MSLMREIREFTVPRGSVAFWFLGQNGFVFKSDGGTVVGTDLYLSNSCAATDPAMAITAPTERSTPPVAMINVIPSDTSITRDACFSTSTRLP